MEHCPLPDAYNCPITFGLMNDPVIDPEGNTFERAAIENWIRAHNTSAITRNPVSVKDLYPNNAIARLLEEEKGRSEGSMHHPHQAPRTASQLENGFGSDGYTGYAEVAPWEDSSDSDDSNYY
jgi:hypothetical protein